MLYLYALAGAFCGAVLAEEAGFFAGLVLGVLIARQQALGRTQAQLAREVAALRDRLAARSSVTPSATTTGDTAPAVPAAAEPAAAADGRPSQPAAEAGHEAAIDGEAAAAHGVAELPPTPATIVPPRESWAPATPPLSARFDAALAGLRERAVRFFTTGNVLAKVGVVLLFFGVAFLARLAVEHGWFPIELRLAAIAAGGLALLATGWRLRHARHGYAVALQGGGVGVLYLTVFAAARLYGLLPMPFAFALLVVLVAASGALAVLQDARALAVLGVSGGFLAPVLTSTGQGSHVALFAYYALLNAGILGIAWYRPWRMLNLLGFVFTYAIGSVWGARYYQPGYFASVEPFLLLSFFFYLALPILYLQRQAPQLRGVVDGTLVFGNPIVFFTLQSQLVAGFEFGRAYSALGLALVYACAARALWQGDQGRARLLAESFLAPALLFATLAIPFAVDGHWTAAAWSLEGAGVAWIGLRQGRYRAQVTGLALEIAAALMFFLHVPARLGPAPPLDASVLGAAMIALAGLFSAWRLERDRERTWPWLARTAPLFLGWGLAWWFAAVATEIDRVLPYDQRLAAFVATFALSGVALATVARRLAWRQGAWPPLAVLPLGGALLVLAFLDHHRHGPWTDGGWFAWPSLLGTGYYLLARYARHWPAAARIVAHVSGLGIAVFLVTWAVAHGVDSVRALGGAWVLASCGAVSALVVLALAGDGAAQRWPVAACPRAYRRHGAGLLLGVVLAPWLVANLGDDGAAWPLPYLPLLNPLDLVALTSLLAALTWWRAQVRAGDALPLPPRVALGIWALAAFVVLNTAILRGVHHAFDVPYRAPALWRSAELQAALSLAWALGGSLVMGLAARRGHGRRAWLVGAGLLGVVVAKLFLVDLAGSGALARVVSFIGVGLVCLVIGYFAPLPGRGEPAGETT
ncbi:MAG: DUF2339 domain-containing protein [Gammaproteobacteria bacterium]|nr:DUF2339 domain-containing protein [Gammaproteobacteria bacterium]